MIKCSTCKKDKENSEFSKNKGTASGHNRVCKQCMKERYRGAKEYWKNLLSIVDSSLESETKLKQIQHLLKEVPRL